MGSDPYVKELSPSARVLYGFKDARVEIKIRPSIGPEVTVPIPKDKVEAIKRVFDEAYAWARRPEADRQDGDGKFSQEIDSRGRARWGFRDGRVEIQVRPFKIGPWLPPFSINLEELELGKPVMDEAYSWSGLPEEVRAMQGCP